MREKEIGGRGFKTAATKKKINFDELLLSNSFSSISEQSLTNRKLKAQTHVFASAC